MIYQLKCLITQAIQNHAQVNGIWVPARPDPGPFVLKLKGAWLVLRGKGDVVIWPEGQ